MNRKMCAVVLAAAVAALGLAGCGREKTEETAGEAISFTYWVGMNPNLASHIQSYNEVAMYRQREKDSGVHIEFMHPAAGQDGEQFNLMVASRSFPDMIEHNWGLYPGGAQKAISDGVIISLNDHLDSAPNFQKALTDKNALSPVYKKGSLTDSGQYYGFTVLNIGDYRIFGGPCIRQDWLDELGLDVPETIDDWTATLRAFKEKKGASAPLSGQIQFLCSGANSAFVGAFGIGSRWYADGKTVKYGPMQDQYKEFLTVLNQWYKEGLLDKDLATNQQTLVDSKIIKGDAGALLCGYLGSAIGRYLKQMQTEDPGYNLTGAPYPAKNKGEINRFPVMEGDVSSQAVAISTACVNPKAAAGWMDYWYSDAGYMLENFGVEGETYTLSEGRPVYTETILKNPNGLSVNEALLLNCRAPAPAPGFNQAPEYLEQYYEFRQQSDALALWTENVAGGRETQMPSLMATAEEADETAAIEADLTTYVNEMIWKFVTGAEPLDNYDAFRGTMKKNFKIERYLEIMQAQYDRYLQR